MCKSFLGLIDFEGMKDSWKAAVIWNSEKPGKIIDKGAVLMTLEVPGLKRLLREVEAWYQVEHIGKGTIQL